MTTTRIKSGPSGGSQEGDISNSSNPLLQPGITASDLFAAYTPTQIAGHLASVKSQLQTYDSELRALINSRYEDVLSVGNTITAMTGSSTQLTLALGNVSTGLRQGLVHDDAKGPGVDAANANAQEQDAEDVLRRREIEDQVKHAAGLLLILQEGPEEIWRMLDSIRTSAKPSRPEGSNSATSSPLLVALKTGLRTARRLSGAVALYQAVELAGIELSDMKIKSHGAPHNLTGRDLFPHPLSSHTSILGSLKAELKSSIEHNIATSSVSMLSKGPLSAVSRPVLKACFEAAYRIVTISMHSLVLLGCIDRTEASTVFLNGRRARLESWVKQQSTSPKHHEAAANVLEALQSELVETILLYTRIFVPKQKTSRSLFEDILTSQTPESQREDVDQPRQHGQHQVFASLVGSTPLTSLNALGSSERILSMLSSQSSLYGWNSPADPAAVATTTLAPGQRLVDWVDSIRAALLTPSQGSRVLADDLPDIRSASLALQRVTRFSKQCHKFLESILEANEFADSNIVEIADTVSNDLLVTIRRRAGSLWQQEVVQWRVNVVKELKAVLVEITTSQSRDSEEGGQDLYNEVFAANRAGSVSDRRGLLHQGSSALSSRRQLQDILDGQNTPGAKVLSRMRKDWKLLQSSRTRYFSSWNADANLKSSSAADEDLRQWTETAESLGWSDLLKSFEGLLHEFPADQPAGRVLSGVIRSFLVLPKYKSLPFEALAGREKITSGTGEAADARWNKDRARLAAKRAGALSKWKVNVVGRSVRTFLCISDTNLSKASSSHQVDGDHPNATENNVPTAPSHELIRSLCMLQQASEQVVPLGSAPDEIDILGRLEGDGGLSASTLACETGSLVNLLVAFSSEIILLLERAKPGRSQRDIAFDIDVLEAIVKGSLPEGKAGQSVRESLEQSFASMRSSLEGQTKSGSISAEELRRLLSPYTLLLGGLVASSRSTLSLPAVVSPRRPSGPHSVSAHTAAPSLLKLAPYKQGGRIQGIAI